MDQLPMPVWVLLKSKKQDGPTPPADGWIGIDIGDSRCLPLFSTMAGVTQFAKSTGRIEGGTQAARCDSQKLLLILETTGASGLVLDPDEKTSESDILDAKIIAVGLRQQ